MSRMGKGGVTSRMTVLYSYLQATFPGPRPDAVFEFSTQVNIVPDVFPFADCHNEDCLGKLV